MSSRIRVGVVDDHPLLREGVVCILSSCSDIEIVAQGASAKDAIEMVQNTELDVLVLDISIPGGGLLALAKIIASKTETKVLMLTVSADESDVLSALRCGAHGYVLKGTSGPELVQALRSVFLDGHYLSPGLGAKLLLDVGLGKTKPKGEAFANLSSREDEIFKLVGRGLNNKEIATKLNLSDKTIKHYMTSVFQKLNVHSRLEAALLVQNKSMETSKSVSSL
jgi:two-component system, NarL family, nitrate/nitrite response regulator NarL